MKKRRKKRNGLNKRSSKIKKIENFVVRQLEKYLKIHREHEKDIRYIG